MSGLFYTLPTPYSEASIWASRVIHVGTDVTCDGTNGWFATTTGVSKVTPAGVATDYAISEFYLITRLIYTDGKLWALGTDPDLDTLFGEISLTGVFTEHALGFDYDTMEYDGTDLWVSGYDTDNDNLKIAKVNSGGVVSDFITIAISSSATDMVWDGTSMWVFAYYSPYTIYKIASAGTYDSFSSTVRAPFATYLDDNLYFAQYDSPYELYKVTSAGASSAISTLTENKFSIGNDGTELWVGSSSDDKVIASTVGGVQTEYDMGLAAPAPGHNYEVDGIIYGGSHLWIAYLDISSES